MGAPVRAAPRPTRSNLRKPDKSTHAYTKYMASIWAEISEVGEFLTLVAVAPFMLGMGILALKAGLFGSDSAMLKQSVELFVGGLLAIVPLSLGGIIMFMFFQFAEEMA